MNIYWQELKYYRRSTIIWIVSLCSVALLFLTEYPSLASQIDVFREVVSKYPKALLQAINFRFEMFYSIFGFFGYILTFIWLAGAIQAMNVGTSIISKEVSGKTADFLMSKPVGRSRLLTEKFLAAVTVILTTNIFFVSVSTVAAKLISPNTFTLQSFLLLSCSLLFVQLFFVALGFLFGALLPKIKSVISITLPTVFALFIISSFSTIVDKPEFSYITPFKYFDPYYIYQYGKYETKYLVALAIFIIVSMAISFVVYTRKDINI